jgi:hypothetical protein
MGGRVTIPSRLPRTLEIIATVVLGDPGQPWPSCQACLDPFSGYLPFVRAWLSKSARDARFAGPEPVRLKKLVDVRICGAPSG